MTKETCKPGEQSSSLLQSPVHSEQGRSFEHVPLPTLWISILPRPGTNLQKVSDLVYLLRIATMWNTFENCCQPMGYAANVWGRHTTTALLFLS